MAEYKSIEQRWLEFRAQVMHPASPPDQVREMRLAFYAGVATLYFSMTDEIAELPEDEGVEMMDKLRDDLEKFQAEMLSGSGVA